MSAISSNTFSITRHKTACLLLAALFVAAALAGTYSRPASAGGGRDAAVIVQLKGDPAAVHAARARQQGRTLSTEELQAYRGQLAAEQDKFLAALASRGVSASLASRGVKNYDGGLAATVPLRYTLVYNGMALSVPEAAVPALRAMPEVKSVSPDQMLTTQLNSSVKYVNAPKAYGKVAELSQFDDLREGFEGQGMYLAVIDTGIDWTHPMFGGDPTPPRLAVAPESAAVQTNKKVVYYLPLSDLGVEDGFGHGTHVASTAAGYLAQHPGADGLPGTSDDIRLHGVAPQAKLMSYKVCSDIISTVDQVVSVGGCLSSNTIMALEDAMSPFTLTGLPKPVAHVINLSLGGSGGPDDPSAVACSNAALAGASVVAASGNSGPDEGTTGSPAAGVHVISVGATTHPGGGSNWSIDTLQPSAVPQTRTGAVTPANNLPTASGNVRTVLYPMSGSAALPAGALAQRYVFVKDPVGAWPANVSGRIALVKSTLDGVFVSVAAQAANAGAVAVIVFDDRGSVNGVKTTIPAAAVTEAEGERLVDALSSTDDNNVDPVNGAISEHPIRLNPFFDESFMGEVAGFSSRGPVQGFGQIKPDVSAPGAAVLAAAPPASLVGALGTLEGTPNYAHLDGTSMASPHVAGAATLIRQAHIDWTADVVRTALINTSTNMRDERAAPRADGLTADSIIAQGGGLIDVHHAINAKALMGVTGDGVEKPGILGSHSFGEVPVINTRTTHTESVPVTVRDLSGQGGTYSLSVANNRDLQIAGINVSVSRPSVTLPPNGEATFNVSATIDGDQLRDVMAAKTNGSQVIFERLQLQWFVNARRDDGGESLRMPFYFRPAPSEPVSQVKSVSTYEGTVAVGDLGAQLAPGTTYVDVTFPVEAGVFKVEGRLDFDRIVEGTAHDLDFELYDAQGNKLDDSLNPGGPEFVSARATGPGTYKYRVIGYLNAQTAFTITSTQFDGAPSPTTLAPVAGEFTDAQSRQVDFDGSFALAWASTGGERGFEVERSSDGGQNWDVVATAAGGAAGVTLTNQPDGQLQYRVRSLYPGRIGSYVSDPSNTQSVVVSRRTLVDITDLVETTMTSSSYAGGIFQLDLVVNNKTTNTYLPRVELRVVSVNSKSGTVRVANADNGGAGTPASPALFGYTEQLGADQIFSAAETTGARTLRFNDPRGELFTYDVQVTAYQGSAEGGSAAAPGGGASGGSGGGSSQSLLSGLAPTSVLRFTANPLTKSVSVQLVKALR